MTETVELKPCPFCGGTDQVDATMEGKVQFETFVSAASVMAVKVVCACGASGRGFIERPDGYIQAAKFWNIRSDPAVRDREDACPSCGGSGRYGDAAQRAIDAPFQPEVVEAEPRVRELVWLSTDEPFFAASPFCQYRISSVEDDTGHHWETTISYRGSMYRRHETEAEAKDAAQADYEQRILSALEPRTSTPEPASGLLE